MNKADKGRKQKVDQARSEASEAKARPVKSFKKVRWIGWGILSLPLLFSAAVLMIWYGTLPDVSDLFRPDKDEPSVIYSCDNVILGSYSPKVKLNHIKPKEVPLFLKEALVLHEDPDFYIHKGLRLSGKSTLTTRLARRLYEIEDQKSFSLWQKAKEALTAIYLERSFTKDEILTHYLNYAYFGGTVYGIEDAARRFFDKKVPQLECDEMALLVGILQAPSAFNPRKFPQKAEQRRNHVLKMMVSSGKLKREDHEVCLNRPVVVSGKEFKVVEDKGLAPYFKEFLKDKLEDWCEKKKLNLYEDGLKIYTTLHSRLQSHAEQAMREHLAQHQIHLNQYLRMTGLFKRNKSLVKRATEATDRYKRMKAKGLSEAVIQDSFRREQPMRVFAWNDKGYTDTIMTPLDSVLYYLRMLESGLVTIQPYKGTVMAYVGGMDYNFFQYDHAWKGKRQVGSTFKPFVYTAAFDTRFSPCDRMLNQPITIQTDEGDEWTPRNADGDYGGEVSLRYGIVHSVNVVTTRLCQEVGTQTVADYAAKMGITSPLKPVPSIGLGTFDLSVAELTSAYTPFVANGRFREPSFIVRIEDRHGKVIESFETESKQVIKEETAYAMVEMLRGVATNGTAAGVRWESGLPYDLDVGGKTGTTQNSSDGWFVGFTPHLVTGVWVGCAERSVNFGHSLLGRGSYMAMPIWGKYMKKVYSDPNLGFSTKERIKRPALFNIQTTCWGDPKKKIKKEESDSTATDLDSTVVGE